MLNVCVTKKAIEADGRNRLYFKKSRIITKGPKSLDNDEKVLSIRMFCGVLKANSKSQPSVLKPRGALFGGGGMFNSFLPHLNSPSKATSNYMDC